MKRHSRSIIGSISGLLLTLFSFLVQPSLLAEVHVGLRLSNMQIKITAKGHVATFQLYDTVAAKEFYNQLPLKLDLINFRNAQWMFYPPQKLHVTAREAYHEGKKGELGYYEPWGDVFMLYKDFYAGDEMHRLGVNLTGMEEIEKMSDNIFIEKNEKKAAQSPRPLRIRVTTNEHTVIFELNNSPAALDLYNQLPLTIKVENYSSNEKICYPPKKLNTKDTPQTIHRLGSLAYYAPWGDVVMFYGSFGKASGLYTLGQAIAGDDNIEKLSGMLRIEKN